VPVGARARRFCNAEVLYWESLSFLTPPERLSNLVLRKMMLHTKKHSLRKLSTF
jgi:hypothetical protein